MRRETSWTERRRGTIESTSRRGCLRQIDLHVKYRLFLTKDRCKIARSVHYAVHNNFLIPYGVVNYVVWKFCYSPSMQVAYLVCR